MTRLSASTLFTVCLCMAAGSLRAQEIETITVTAQKREQNESDVGISITAFGTEDIRRLGLTSGPDLAAQTPGLQFAEVVDDFVNVVNIRGVSQNDFGLHQESPIAVYQDYNYVGFNSAINLPFFDLQRIEVLRGPQGTLFGRNSTGGAILYYSQPPEDTFSAFADLEAGERDYLRVEGALGGPLGERWAGRVSGLVNQFDDFVDNIGPAHDFRGRQQRAGRARLRYTRNTLRLDLIGSYYAGETHLAAQHAANGFDEDGLEFRLRRDQDFWGTCAGCDSAGYRERNEDPYEVEMETDGIYDYRYRALTGLLAWDLAEDVELDWVSGLLDFDSTQLLEGDNSPRDGSLLAPQQRFGQFSQELRIRVVRGRRDWLAGIHYLDRDADQSEDVRFGLADADLVFSALGFTPPGFLASLGEALTLDSDWRLKTRSWAGFAHLAFPFRDELTLVGGLRWTRDELDYRFRSVESVDGVVLGSPGIFGSTFFADTHSEDQLAGQLGLEWRPSVRSLYYATISRGTKGGGFNAPIFGGPVTEFSGEVLTSYEIGFKGSWHEQRARLHAGVFYYDYRDYQAFTFRNFALDIANRDATAAGFEAEFAALVGRGWEFGLGLSYLDAEVRDVALPGGRVTARDMPLAPRLSVNPRLRYEWTLPWGALSAQLDGNYTSSYYSEVLNNPAGEIASQWSGNASLSFAHATQPWRLTFSVRNLSDEQLFVYRLPTGTGITNEISGRPRWLSLRFGYAWH